MSVRRAAAAVDLLVAQVRCLADPHLVLLECLPDERGLHVRVPCFGSSARQVPGALILLDEHPARPRAQQPPVHLRDLQSRRDRRLMPEIPHFRVGAHRLTLPVGKTSPHTYAARFPVTRHGETAGAVLATGTTALLAIYCYRHDYLVTGRRSTATLICDGAARSCFHTQPGLSRIAIGSAGPPGGGSLPILHGRRSHLGRPCFTRKTPGSVSRSNSGVPHCSG